MSRAARLLDLLQRLRARRTPVAGAELACELGVSLRTLYRDIETLRAQGADIAGEGGLGYVLAPGFTLPPLMFSLEELEALALGMRWVAGQSDPALAEAARSALGRIAAVLPAGLREEVDSGALLAPQTAPPSAVAGAQALAAIRAAMRAERKLVIDYADEAGATTRRTVWPLALAFFAQARVMVAWCELRDDFRHFRLDRIAAFDETQQRFAHRRALLLAQWRQRENIPADILHVRR